MRCCDTAKTYPSRSLRQRARLPYLGQTAPPECAANQFGDRVAELRLPGAGVSGELLGIDGEDRAWWRQSLSGVHDAFFLVGRPCSAVNSERPCRESSASTVQKDRKMASVTPHEQRSLLVLAGRPAADQSPELRAQLGEITDDETPPPSRHKPALPQRRQCGGHGSPRQPRRSSELLLGETKVRLLATRN